MWTELRAIVAGILQSTFESSARTRCWTTRTSPRATGARPPPSSIHHAFLGGLIEHVLSLCALAKLVAPHYPTVDRDLLLAGVVLHDIGKIYELNYERGFSYSNEGPAARPHRDRHAHGGRQAARASRIFRRACASSSST